MTGKQIEEILARWPITPTREQIETVIWALEVEASNRYGDGMIDSLEIFAEGTVESRLAYAAWLAIYDCGAHTKPWDDPAVSAEAACLLRDGWLPGDPVTLLKPRSS